MEISKIILKIGKKRELSLSLEEAKELKNILNDAFSEKEVQHVPYYQHYPWIQPNWTTTIGTDSSDGTVWGEDNYTLTMSSIKDTLF